MLVMGRWGMIRVWIFLEGIWVFLRIDRVWGMMRFFFFYLGREFGWDVGDFMC